MYGWFIHSTLIRLEIKRRSHDICLPRSFCIRECSEVKKKKTCLTLQTKIVPDPGSCLHIPLKHCFFPLLWLLKYLIAAISAQ